MGRAPPRGVKNGFSKPILPATAFVEAGAILKGAAKASKRTLGEAHPLFRLIKIHLIRARNERAFLDLEARYGEGCLKH